MTREEYYQKLEALEREIAALRSEAVEDGPTPKPPHPRWKPEPGEDYYLIGNAGDVYGDGIDELLGRGRETAKSRAEIGNIFAKADEAEFAVMRLKTLADMREWAGEWNDPWVMIYDGYKVEAIPVYGKGATYGELRFASEKDANNCIKAVGKDRLIKYYFGVQDHEIPAETE